MAVSYGIRSVYWVSAIRFKALGSDCWFLENLALSDVHTVEKLSSESDFKALLQQAEMAGKAGDIKKKIALQKTSDHLVNRHRMAKYLYGVRNAGSALMNWMVDPIGKVYSYSFSVNWPAGAVIIMIITNSKCWCFNWLCSTKCFVNQGASRKIEPRKLSFPSAPAG